MRQSEIPEFLKELSATEGKQVVSEPTTDPDKIYISPMLLSALSWEELLRFVRQSK
jgi:hypothetical protein